METLLIIWGLVLPFLAGYFGWVLYCFFMFKREKDKADNAATEFLWKDYRRKNWDNWAWSFLLVPVLVIYMQDIIAILNHVFGGLGVSIPYFKIYYLFVGVLTELVYMLIAAGCLKVKALFAKLTPQQ